VLDPDREVEALGHPRAEVDRRVEGDVHGLHRTAAPLVDRRRNPEAERGDLVVEQLLDRAVEPGEQVILRRDGGRVLAVVLDTTVTSDDSRQDLGPAEVDPDDAFSVQSARLPYWLDGDGRKALPRLPRRAREGPRAARAPAEPPRAERAHAARTARPQAAPKVELASPHRRRVARRLRADRDLVDPRLPFVPPRRGEGGPPP